ncbi:M20 aminoacylase family protein [Defluviicoccus vanus]|uniref:Amidohydrolase n=1 Tax=Defluviicoccus vanus TaxID=111831 RepID=A0A7H1MZZ8_9PROT|nr:M20 aminoacylase family protein [Defluviicoccus vanus]QNT69034.1 amidohydrolase [Defluviicoccus vanus]
MPLIQSIVDRHPEMTTWRRSLHAHPETAFEEVRTAAFVAAKLRAFGFSVTEGLARTGVVGSLSNGDGPAIGLRADMDALPIAEAGQIAHRSTVAGKMHACGHDGHTAMLLGAAQYLAASRQFRGTVHLIFQPAEENEGGGRVMVEEGLFDRFPVAAVYGLHNWPNMPAGSMALRAGPLMAACDAFEIIVEGKGCHGAMPHLGTDAIVAAAAIVGALQTVVSRSINPYDAAVVSVTQFSAGDTWNVIPEQAVLRGTTRSFRPEVQSIVAATLARVASDTAAAHGCVARVDYRRQYPATVNEPAATEIAARAAMAVVGEERVELAPTPSMGAEDFAYMLQRCAGCYVWLGSGRSDGDAGLHNAHYDFNDAVLPIGASYWATLVEQNLPIK